MVPEGESEALTQTTSPPSSAPLALTAALVDQNAARALAAVDARIQFYTEVRNRTVRLTLPTDWTDHDGSPYLGSYGVERLKPLWGIYIKQLLIEPSLDEVRARLRRGEHVSVQVIGLAGSRVTGEESEFLGGRSSDDGWFSERSGGIAALDPEDLVKAAISNFEVNAITRLLGLRGMTWEELAKYGIERAKARSVTYRAGGAARSDEVRDPMIGEIRAGLEKVHGPNAVEALKILTRFTAKDGTVNQVESWEKLSHVSDKWLSRILDKVRIEVEGWETQQAQKAAATAAPR